MRIRSTGTEPAPLPAFPRNQERVDQEQGSLLMVVANNVAYPERGYCCAPRGTHSLYKNPCTCTALPIVGSPYVVGIYTAAHGSSQRRSSVRLAHVSDPSMHLRSSRGISHFASSLPRLILQSVRKEIFQELSWAKSCGSVNQGWEYSSDCGSGTACANTVDRTVGYPPQTLFIPTPVLSH